jgi:hypothetical protein
MDSLPEKFIYVPLPQLPRLPRTQFRRRASLGPRLHRAVVAVIRSSARARARAQWWWRRHALDVALAAAASACGVVVALVAASFP